MARYCSTKMHSPISSQRSKRKLFVGALGVLAAAFLVVILGQAVPGPIRSVALTLGKPVWHVAELGRSLVASVQGFGQSNNQLAAENAALVEELHELRRSTFMARSGSLAGEARVMSPDQAHAIPASVLVSDKVAPFDLLVVDRGTNDGVSAGALVVTEEGYAVGSVWYVAASTAGVRMFSATGALTGLYLTDRATSTLHLTVHGRGSGTLMARVPRDQPVGPNDVLMLPGDRWIEVANVVHVENEPEAAYKVLVARLHAQSRQLRSVLILPDHTWQTDPGFVDMLLQEHATSTDE